jgi:curved DNA-binding protein CbpA
MSDNGNIDYYEALQLSPNADSDTIQRVYRLLARRFHPDNADTGNESRFRQIHDAYTILSDPESRAKYDVFHQHQRQDRWKIASSTLHGESDFELERIVRLTVLEMLYMKRRNDPRNPGIFSLDLEELTGRPREHLEFTVWFLLQKKHVHRDDNSRLVITAEGVEHFEENFRMNLRRRLQAAESVRPAPESAHPAA